MRRFIRLHPWRLEIVPAVAFLAAVGHAAYYHISGAEEVLRRGAYPGEPSIQYEATILFQVFLLVFFWVIAAASNHQWVLLERRKLYNWTAVLSQVTILSSTGFAVFLVRTGLPGINPNSVASNLNAIPVIVLAGTAVTAVLEWTRRFVPRDFGPEPDPPSDGSVLTRAGFRYIEKGVEWGWLVCGVGALAYAAIALLSFRNVFSVSCGVVAGIFLCGLSRRRLETSHEGFVMRAGLCIRRIRMDDVASCRATWDEHGQRPRGVSRQQWHQFSWNTGRCLEITTKQGNIYRFGMLRPQYARGLIESVMGTDEGESAVTQQDV